ncbi:hypothetical protein EVA_07856 [gut metagenome]|uniref:Uncharacterized protein n=1 Tax=gut metagenome TaxID=749906 RepID=J9G9U8_9ZZZZ
MVNFFHPIFFRLGVQTVDEQELVRQSLCYCRERICLVTILVAQLRIGVTHGKLLAARNLERLGERDLVPTYDSGRHLLRAEVSTRRIVLYLLDEGVRAADLFADSEAHTDDLHANVALQDVLREIDGHLVVTRKRGHAHSLAFSSPAV